VAGSRRTDLALTALCALVAAIGLWNVAHYPPGRSYDAPDNIPYADKLIPGLHLPVGSAYHLPAGAGSYYTPPGYYAVAGTADWIAGGIGVGDRHRAGMAVNVLFLLGSVLLVARIARELWPGHERIALGAGAFVAFLPVATIAATMFHPESLSFFCSTLALWAGVRSFSDRRFVWALGVALGAGQLVRAFALWTVAVTVIAFLVARRFRDLIPVLAVALLIPLPWYIHQTVKYGSPLFPRPVTPLAQTATGKPKPLWDRQPAAFFVAPGIPQIVTAPYVPHFANRFWPELYAGVWGDWLGVWTWNHGPATPVPSAAERHRLQVQSVVGILPTLLAIVGWIALLAGSLRTPSRLAVALLPAVGLLGLLYFTVSYPVPDGDTIKATYLLTTAASWALGFGYALDRLRGRAWIGLAALLAVGAIAELPFLIY